MNPYWTIFSAIWLYILKIDHTFLSYSVRRIGITWLLQSVKANHTPLSSSLSFRSSTTRLTINSPASSCCVGASKAPGSRTLRATSLIFALVIPCDANTIEIGITDNDRANAHLDLTLPQEKPLRLGPLWSQFLLEIHGWLPLQVFLLHQLSLGRKRIIYAAESVLNTIVFTCGKF